MTTAYISNIEVRQIFWLQAHCVFLRFESALHPFLQAKILQFLIFLASCFTSLVSRNHVQGTAEGRQHPHSSCIRERRQHGLFARRYTYESLRNLQSRYDTRISVQIPSQRTPHNQRQRPGHLRTFQPCSSTRMVAATKALRQRHHISA